MHYTNHIDSFSVYSSVCAQKSLTCTSPDFDPVTPLYYYSKVCQGTWRSVQKEAKKS